MSTALAIDLGGTNVRVALVSDGGRIVGSVRERVADPAPEAVAGQIATMARGLGEMPSGVPVVVDVAGSVWTGSGVVLNAPNLGWREAPFGEVLSARLGEPVRLVNDLNAITYGEAMAGGGRGERDVACVFVGTGVGMGAVVNGVLVEGADGLAPELGHVKIASPYDGRLCGCGQRGCLEAYVSGRHLPELLLEKTRTGLVSSLLSQAGDGWRELRADQIDAAAAAGDAAARALWDDVGQHLAWALGTLVMMLNPRVLVLGGGVLNAAPALYERVTRNIWAHAWPEFGKHLRIERTTLADDAGVIGAGLMALTRPR